jgi:hypothetical protein
MQLAQTARSGYTGRAELQPSSQRTWIQCLDRIGQRGLFRER